MRELIRHPCLAYVPTVHLERRALKPQRDGRRVTADRGESVLPWGLVIREIGMSIVSSVWLKLNAKATIVRDRR